MLLAVFRANVNIPVTMLTFEEHGLSTIGMGQLTGSCLARWPARAVSVKACPMHSSSRYLRFKYGPLPTSQLPIILWMRTEPRAREKTEDLRCPSEKYGAALLRRISSRCSTGRPKPQSSDVNFGGLAELAKPARSPIKLRRCHEVGSRCFSDPAGLHF